MTERRCVVIGAGCLAGGFVAPLLRAAGWEVLLVTRSSSVAAAINLKGGLWLRTVGNPPTDRWIDGIDALTFDSPTLLSEVAAADLLAVSVGPSALADVGRRLAPLVRARMTASTAPANIIAFENHRRAPELLAMGLIESDGALAGRIGRDLGIAGAAAWRIVARRELTAAGLRFDTDRADECYVDAASLVPGAAPLDGSLPGLELVRPFDVRMVEKLWVFSAGHAATAYIGWRAGCATLDAALAHPEVRQLVRAVVAEAQEGLQASLVRQPGTAALPRRPVDDLLDRYSDPGLGDSVARVAREPRRKLAAGDRLIGPSVACMSAGIRPVALATAAAAALTYAEPADSQALDLQRELDLVGPEEVLATLSGLEPSDELSRLICARYRELHVEASAAHAAAER